MKFFFIPGIRWMNKNVLARGNCGPKAREAVENRYLPILHSIFFLRDLCASNEPLAFWGEWAVRH